MPERQRLLVLAGTGAASALVRSLADDRRVEVIASLAGVTSAPAPLPCRVIRGGFGGVSGLADFLKRERIDIVVDATHPFAAVMSANAVEACGAADVRRLMLARPAWQPQPGDQWIEVESVTAAAAAVPQLGRRAFLTVGRKEVAAFAGIEDVWFLTRLLESPEGTATLPAGLVIRGRGPFAVADERALIEKHRIDLVVSKNAGGSATYAKIAAAREARIPVLMVRQPPSPEGPAVTDVPQALEWIEAALR